jgi:hypothetical protein
MTPANSPNDHHVSATKKPEVCVFVPAIWQIWKMEHGNARATTEADTAQDAHWQSR